MQLHASCVAFDGRAILIRGASGSGKSSLALELIALGADLVADDRVDVTESIAAPIASAPARLFGLIEARGIGVLHVKALKAAEISVMVNLDRTETARLPDAKHEDLIGHMVPLLHKVESPYFAVALRQYLIGGLSDR